MIWNPKNLLIPPHIPLKICYSLLKYVQKKYSKLLSSLHFFFLCSNKSGSNPVSIASSNWISTGRNMFKFINRYNKANFRFSNYLFQVNNKDTKLMSVEVVLVASLLTLNTWMPNWLLKVIYRWLVAGRNKFKFTDRETYITCGISSKFHRVLSI